MQMVYTFRECLSFQMYSFFVVSDQSVQKQSILYRIILERFSQLFPERFGYQKCSQISVSFAVTCPLGIYNKMYDIAIHFETFWDTPQFSRNVVDADFSSFKVCKCYYKDGGERNYIVVTRRSSNLSLFISLVCSQFSAEIFLQFCIMTFSVFLLSFSRYFLLCTATKPSLQVKCVVTPTTAIYQATIRF